jgi:hypothetical protein
MLGATNGMGKQKSPNLKTNDMLDKVEDFIKTKRLLATKLPETEYDVEDNKGCIFLEFYCVGYFEVVK